LLFICEICVYLRFRQGSKNYFPHKRKTSELIAVSLDSAELFITLSEAIKSNISIKDVLC
jgi:hypothetical protein